MGLFAFNFDGLIVAQAAAAEDPWAALPRVGGLAPLIQPAGLQPAPNRYIVVFRSNTVGAADVAGASAQAEALGGEVTFLYTAALQGYAANLSPKALKAIRSNPLVKYVVMDAVVQLDDPASEGEAADELSAGEVGAETIQNSAWWGLDRIDQRDLPRDTKYEYATLAGTVHVYILDTGIRSTHVEFEGRANKVFDAVGDGENGNDCNGHGTHVAGTIGGKIFGVAKKARLHAVRVLDCNGFGLWSGIIAGVDWVTLNHVSPAVANMSLGGSAFPLLDLAIRNSILSGVTYVVAAGNSNDNACSYSPARTAHAITVAATDKTDTRAFFSNFGTCVDIFAPGVDIKSAWIGSNNAYNRIQGTSMASPHVAGVVALYLSKVPGATPNQVWIAIRNGSSMNKVTDPAGTPNRLLYSRFGPLALLPHMWLVMDLPATLKEELA